VNKLLAMIECFLFGHTPDRTRGYYGEPAKGSHCLECGKVLNP
jgi:hypothetical protein